MIVKKKAIAGQENLFLDLSSKTERKNPKSGHGDIFMKKNGIPYIRDA